MRDAELSASALVAIARGRSAWPSLALDPHDFARWLGNRAGDSARDFEGLWLCRACLVRLPGAAEALEAQVLAPALQALPPADREEVGQRVLEQLLGADPPRLVQFEGRGPLASWVRTAVARAHSKLKGRTNPKGTLSGAKAVAAPARPDVELEKREAKGRLQQALAQALGALPADDRELLARHYLDGVPHGELADAAGVPRSTLAYRLSKLRLAVLEATRKGLAAQGLAPEEIDALVGMAAGSLKVSLPAVPRIPRAAGRRKGP